MENTTQLFLAVRFNCNKCHDHPFERWTQDQYYQTAAFFAQIGLDRRPCKRRRKIGGTAVEGAKPLYEIVDDTQGRRNQARAHRRGRAAAVPVRRAARRQARCHPARGAGRAGSRRREPVLRQELRQPHVGLPARRRDHRADRRHPRRQPADQSRAARLADQGVHRQRLRRAPADPD